MDSNLQPFWGTCFQDRLLSNSLRTHGAPRRNRTCSYNFGGSLDTMSCDAGNRDVGLATSFDLHLLYIAN